MNPGVQAGVKDPGWTTYQPDWVGVTPLGTTPPSVQPSIGNGTLIGRYYLSSSGVVVANISLTFGSTTVPGTGDNAWFFGLPLPFNRFTGSSTIPIGIAVLKQDPASSPYLTAQGAPSYLVGPFTNTLSQGREDYYVGVDGIQAMGQGTGSITNATSTTITHGLGYTPYAWDIWVTPTALTAGSANVGQPYITNIGATTFDVNVPTNPGSGKTLSFSWKCNATPGADNTQFNSTVASSTKPWAWTTNHTLSMSLFYPPRS